MATINPKVGLPAGDTVITYIFDKTFHPNIKNIVKWLNLWGCNSSGIKESANNYRVKQDNAKHYELGTLRTIDIADGISAVVGRIKVMATRKKKRNSTVRLSNPGKRTAIEESYFRSLPTRVGTMPNHIARGLVDKGMIYIDNNGYYQKNKKNPMHFPLTKRGRPRKRGRPSKAKGKMFSRGRKAHIAWWILDLYRGTTLLTTAMGQGTKANATLEAKSMMGRHIRHKTVNKITLSGPYESKPSKELIHSMVRR